MGLLVALLLLVGAQLGITVDDHGDIQVNPPAAIEALL